MFHVEGSGLPTVVYVFNMDHQYGWVFFRVLVIPCGFCMALTAIINKTVGFITRLHAAYLAVSPWGNGLASWCLSFHTGKDMKHLSHGVMRTR